MWNQPRSEIVAIPSRVACHRCRTIFTAPGAIPPFGSLFGLPTFCDRRLGENEEINFNAGDHSLSISLRYADHLSVEQPERGELSE